MSGWKKLDKYAIALYPFPANGKFQISLRVGERLKVQQQSDNGQWLKGISLTSNQQGIFPACYVELADSIGEPSSEFKRTCDPVVHEITKEIKEWGSLMKKHYREKRFVEFMTLKDKLALLVDWRRKLITTELPEEIRQELKNKIMDKIDEGRKALGLDIVVRAPSGELADFKNTSIVTLYHMHVDIADKEYKETPGGMSVLSQAGDKTPKGLLRDKGSLEKMGSLTRIAAMRRAKLASQQQQTPSSSPVSTPSQQRRRTGSIASDSSAAATAEPIASSPLANGPTSSLNQVLLDFQAFICKVGEDTELHFFLYSHKQRSVLTESFLIQLTAAGMASDVSKIGQQKALFRDIHNKELARDNELYLVCRIIRVGKLAYKDVKESDRASSSTSAKGKSSVFRRPFGCAVLNISPEVFSRYTTKKADHTMVIYRSVSEAVFPELHELIISKAPGIEPVPLATGLVVSLQRYAGEFDEVVKGTPELANVAVANKLQFPEVIYPGEMRNDFYLTLERGEFVPEGHSTSNIEVIVCARLDTGQLVQNCISFGCGEKPKSLYRSVIYYHTNTPRWSEILRFTIPLDVFARTHVHFNIRHCSSSESKEKKDKSGFAFAFLKLTSEDGTVIEDGEHVVPTYRPPKTTDDMVFYLKGVDPKLQRPKNEQIVVNTRLSSAKLTKNAALRQLLAWKENESDLAEILKKITFVDKVEIIKFLKEVFDAMFAILDSKPNFSMLVYNALIFIIGILVDEKTSTFSNFRPVLDLYIEKHFSGKMAHKTLMSCLQYYLEKFDSSSHARLIRDSMKALEYIIKFIVVSRQQYNKLSFVSAGEEDRSFRESMLECLGNLNNLMAQASPTLIGAQTIALKNFSLLFAELGKLFDARGLATIAVNFIDSIQYFDGKKSLNLEKLALLHEIVAGRYYADPEARPLLTPVVIRTLRLHMDKSIEELLECLAILQVLLESIQTDPNSPASNELLWQLFDLLPVLVASGKLLTSSSSSSTDQSVIPQHSRTEFVTCVLALYYLLTRDGAAFDRYLRALVSTATGPAADSSSSSSGGGDGAAAIDKTKRLREFINTTFDLFDDFLGDGYPDNWFGLVVFLYSTVLEVISRLSPHLTAVGIVEPEPWRRLLLLCVRPIISPALQVEWFSESKQAAVRARYGDLRFAFAELLQREWKQLDRMQMELLPHMVEPFLLVVRLPSNQLRQIGINLYLSLLEREFTETGSFKTVSTYTIDTLDKFGGDADDDDAGVDSGDERHFSVYLLKALEVHFATAPETTFTLKARELIGELRQLSEHLVALRTLPSGPEYEDERVLATMKLMEHLLQTGRKDAYIKYVHMLADQHAVAGNFVEAGLTLLLHADLLAFDRKQLLEEQQDFPQESAAERKEKLYKRAIGLFDQGKAWERAIALVKALTNYYETVTYDYRQLCELLHRQAAFYQHIIEGQRFFSEFFLVGYYGRGFPANIQGKEFVYRGYELEKLADFTSRICAKFPNAELLKSTEKPGAEIVDGDGQWLLITSVAPSSEEEAMGTKRAELENDKLPSAVRNYMKYNDVCVFVYSKPFRKKKSDNPFADLWIRRTYLFTANKLPAINRRTEVVRRVETESSPIENAVTTVQQKTEEIQALIEVHSKDTERKVMLNPFTMLLNGVIDAAVGGGIKTYQEAFFNPEYERDNPGDLPMINKLKKAILDQVDVVGRGLRLHRLICPEDMQKLQEKLDTFYEEMKSKVRREIVIDE